jgi:hypothetical protein
MGLGDEEKISYLAISNFAGLILYVGFICGDDNVHTNESGGQPQQKHASAWTKRSF